MQEYLLTVDAGTGSTRAVIFNLSGEQVAIGQREWSHVSEAGVPHSMGFDVVNNWPLICDCIRQAIFEANIDPGQILAVSATSMREGIVLYDAQGNELWAVANVDARADEEVRCLKGQFDGIEREFYHASGQTFALGALPRILWLKNHHPELYDKTAAVEMISDWVLTRLCGVIATEPSNGGTTGIFSLAERHWLPEMAARIGIRSDIFPQVVEPGTQIGEVSSHAATQTGLLPGTPVVMGGGDVQLGSAGLGVVKRGDMAVIGGSFWQQVVNIDADVAPPEDMAIRVNPHVINGLSQAEGITFFSGLVMRWFRDAFCEGEILEAARRGLIPIGFWKRKPLWYHRGLMASSLCSLMI